MGSGGSGMVARWVRVLDAAGSYSGGMGGERACGVGVRMRALVRSAAGGWDRGDLRGRVGGRAEASRRVPPIAGGCERDAREGVWRGASVA